LEDELLRTFSDRLALASVAHLTDVGPDCARYMERRLL